MIQYKKNVMPSKGIEARPMLGKTASTKEIAQEIEKTVGIPAIRTMSVLDAFVEMAYRHMENGEPVQLDGFGTFKPGLSVEGEKVIAKKVNLIASAAMKGRLRSFLTSEMEN